MMDREEEHTKNYCHDCGHYNYDSHHDESWCSHKRGKSNTIVSGRETDCEDWIPSNHPDIIAKRKIDDFFKGFEKFPDMKFIYENCFKEELDKVPEECKDDLIISFLGRTYNAAISRYRKILKWSGMDINAETVSKYREWQNPDKIEDHIDRVCKNEFFQNGFEIVLVESKIPDYGDIKHYKLTLRYTRDDDNEVNNIMKATRAIVEFLPEDYMNRIKFVVDY